MNRVNASYRGLPWSRLLEEIQAFNDQYALVELLL